jgi:uncharacterized membrane protein YozB (DUF420 family)
MATNTVERVPWSAERRFYTFMAVAIFVAMYVGFARTFFLRPWFPEAQSMSPPEPFFYFHGAVFTAWFALLLLQPALVGAGRTDLHRAIGRFGAALAVGVVAVGAMGALIAARRAGGFIGIPVPPAQFVIIPFVDLALYALLIGMAIARRRDSQSHKRLMLVGSLCLIDAAIARWPVVISVGNPLLFFALTDLFLVPLAIWDFKTRGRPHPVTLWAGLLLIVSQPLRLWLSGTDAWLQVISRIL